MWSRLGPRPSHGAPSWERANNKCGQTQPVLASRGWAAESARLVAQLWVSMWHLTNVNLLQDYKGTVRLAKVVSTAVPLWQNPLSHSDPPAVVTSLCMTHGGDLASFPIGCFSSSAQLVLYKSFGKMLFFCHADIVKIGVETYLHLHNR